MDVILVNLLTPRNNNFTSHPKPIFRHYFERLLRDYWKLY
jgi:hypothetical protein